MPILCGTDLTSRSEPAVRAAAALAARLGEGSLQLVHALDGDAAEAWPQIRGIADRMARRWELRVECAVEDGNPADVLLREAERAAALLVVSCTGHGHALLLRTGGTAERVAESARVPTLVVHDAAPFEEWATRRRPLRVVLGLGDGAADAAAVAWVGRLRRGGDCDVAAVSIYDPVEALHRYGLQRIGSVLDPDPRVERLIQAEIDASLAKLEGTGAVSSRIVAAPGRRGDHLLEVAAKEQADLIVVGAHPKGWLKRLSSVSSVTLHWRNTSVACIPA